MTKIEEIFNTYRLNNTKEEPQRIINPKDGIKVNLLPCYYMDKYFIDDLSFDAGIRYNAMEEGQDICDNIIYIREKIGDISRRIVYELAESWFNLDYIEESNEYLNMCPCEQQYIVRLGENAFKFFIDDINQKKISIIRNCNQIISLFYQIIDPYLYDFCKRSDSSGEFIEDCYMYFPKDDYLKVKELYDLTSQLKREINFHFTRNLPEILDEYIPYVCYPKDSVKYMNKKLNTFRKILEDAFDFNNMNLDK